MSRKRIKNIVYDDDFDDYDDYDDYHDYHDYPQHVKPKSKGKGLTKNQAKKQEENINKINVVSASKTTPATVVCNSTPVGMESVAALEKPAEPTKQTLSSSLAAAFKATTSDRYPSSSSAAPFESPASDLSDTKDDRQALNLVVVGHVDAGKSTLMGHLLVKMNAVTAKQLHEFRNESKQIGKGSFLYAWVLDEGQDERRRGVTIDICVKYFKTNTKNVTVLDAPGHKDFIPNMLLGAVQADTAVLVVDARNFAAGFERGGQTKEHVQLVRALGISRLLVVINKLDLFNWDEDKFNSIKDQLHTFITGPEVRYKEQQIQYIPASAFEGINLVDDSETCLDNTLATERLFCCLVTAALRQWWKGPTLIGAIDQFDLQLHSFPSTPACTPRSSSATKQIPINDELKAIVSDIWTSGSTVTASVKLEAGILTVGDKIKVLPSNALGSVKGLECRGHAVRQCTKGDYVESVVLKLDPLNIHVGSVIASPNPSTLKVTTQIVVRLVVFDVDLPLCQGQQVMSYVHTSVQPAIIRKLIATINKSSKQRNPKKPRALARGDMALVQLTFPHNVVVDYYADGGNALCRVILRDRGKTIAAGMAIDPVNVE